MGCRSVTAAIGDELVISAEADGLDELRNAIGKVTDEVRDAIVDAARAEAQQILADERALVPVLTGELHDNLEVWFDTGADGNVSVSIGLRNSELFWAVFIEWGRSSAAAQPFATPASESARKRWPARARKALAAAVKARG